MPQVLLHILTEPDVCCEVWLHSVPAVSTFAEMRLVVAFLMSVVTVEGWVPCFCTPHPTPPHPHTPPPAPIVHHPGSHHYQQCSDELSMMMTMIRGCRVKRWGRSSSESISENCRQVGVGERWMRGLGGGGCWDPLISSGKIMWQTNSHTSIHTIRWLGSSSNAAERESFAYWY